MNNEGLKTTRPANDKAGDLTKNLEIKTLDMVSKSTSVFYGDLPKELQSNIDSLASHLFDPHGGRSLVIGNSMSGKSFLIEQLANNIDHYVERLSIGKIIFVYLNVVDAALIEDLPGKYEAYISAVTQILDVKEEQICFVTDSIEAAITLSVHSKKCKIIFELSVETFSALISMPTESWNSWPIIDANMVGCTKTELVNLLHLSLHDHLKEAYNVEILKKDILLFINYTINKIPELYSGRPSDPLAAPPGIWATAIRRIAGYLAFLPDEALEGKKRNASLSKACRVAFEEVVENLDEFLGMGFMIPAGGEISDETLGQMGVKVVSSGAKPGPPNSQISRNSFGDFDTLSDRLKTEVIGQDDAVEAVADGLIVPAAGLSDTDKPIRSMMFLGPTGVGKTKLALTLAAQLMDKPLNVVRLDMSEYAQPNEAVKLFGAPPGYIGHDKGGVLTSAILKDPHSLILLDEVEKAHPVIWDAMLQVLDAGRMTTGTGQEVDFTNTVIVMTSNLGTKEVSRISSGFASSMVRQAAPDAKAAAKTTILKAVEDYLKPELINRIDEMIIFQALSQDTARKILHKEIDVIYKRAEIAGFKLAAPDSDIIDALLEKSDVSKYGAREIQRVVLKNVSTPIARSMLKKERSTMDVFLTIDENNEISVSETMIRKRG